MKDNKMALKRSIFLSIKNRGGSTQHYYHYLLGYLVPLIIKLKIDNDCKNQFFTRSCAIMDRHTTSLNYKNLTLIFLRKRERDTDPSNYDFYENLYGFDDPPVYNQKIFIQFREIIKNIFKHELSFLDQKKQPKTILIKRGIDPFYSS